MGEMEVRIPETPWQKRNTINGAKYESFTGGDKCTTEWLGRRSLALASPSTPPLDRHGIGISGNDGSGIWAVVVVLVQDDLAGADHASEMRADEGGVLVREGGAVLALDVTQDRRLVGDVIILQRDNRLHDHLRGPRGCDRK